MASRNATLTSREPVGPPGTLDRLGDLATNAPYRPGLTGAKSRRAEMTKTHSRRTRATKAALQWPADRTLRIGTCPYEYYFAKTYAAELWLAAGAVVVFSLYRKRLQ